MSLARTRLWLGITGVGLTTTLAAVGLALDLPARFFADDPAVPIVASSVAALLWPLAWTIVMLPLDALGGFVAVRQRPSPGHWLLAWLRGVGLQLAVLLLAGMLLLAATRALGALGAAIVVVVGSTIVLSQLDRLCDLVRQPARRPRMPAS
jgi:hypothetical protein